MIYLQDVLGYSALGAGLRVAVLSVAQLTAVRQGSVGQLLASVVLARIP